MHEASKLGLPLDGRPLVPWTRFRLRPYGHRAVLVTGHYGKVIDYEPGGPEHIAAEPPKGVG